MTVYVGGLRIRLIRESVYRVVHQGLTDLGWFAGGRQHGPITITGEDLPDNHEIVPTTIALADGPIIEIDAEMGSNMTTQSIQVFWDVYGEDEAIALHLVTDIRDIIRGRMPSIGRTGPVVDVLDYTIATPPVIFSVQITDTQVERAEAFRFQYQQHWYSCKVVVEDSYTDENG